MTHQAVRDLARRLERLEQGVTAQNVPQLAASSVEAGAIPHYDSSGQMTALVGEQHDGTTAAAVLAGPVPPAPLGVDASGGQLTVTATWDGTFVGDAVAPMDFARVEVHRGATEDFIVDPLPTSTTRVGSIEHAGGGSFTWTQQPGDVWVTMITRATTGKASEPLAYVMVEVDSAVDPAVFEQAAKDLNDARTRLAGAESRLAGAQSDLYDPGGVVDALKGTLTGKVTDATDLATQALDTAKRVAAIVRIDSTRGVMFKDNQVATTLKVTIFKGDRMITDILALREAYGPAAYIEWQWQRLNETTFGVISSADPRISEGGFALTLSPADVDSKVVFRATVNGDF